MKNSLLLLFIMVIAQSCVSTQSTLKNVDDQAPLPTLSAQNTFVITQFSKDKKYGYDPDYPVNVFYKNIASAQLNQERFLKALAGPKGEKIEYVKTGICCPYPNKKTEMGVASLDVYHISWAGLKTPLTLYLNSYEKGVLMVPVGLTLQKN